MKGTRKEPSEGMLSAESWRAVDRGRRLRPASAFDKVKTVKVIFGIAAVAGFLSCATIARTPYRASDTFPQEYGGKNAPYYYHAEGIKAYAVERDSARSIGFLNMAVSADSTYASAYYGIAEILLNEGDASRAVSYSRKAGGLDTANLTYQSQLGRALVMAEKYDDALPIYTRLMRDDPYNPLNYKLLAALYDYSGQPFTAVSILDTAEMRLGRLEELTAYKREILIRVNLYAKALEEAEKLAADYPYDDDNYRAIGDIYSVMGRDSLAFSYYAEAMRLDSSNLGTLSSLAAYYRKHNDARNYLVTMRAIFGNESMPLEGKKKIFSDITSDLEFYRNNYFGINALISTLVTKHPQDYAVLDMYASHLIRGGEIEQGLQLYKAFLDIDPTVLDAYREIIWIETYLMRPDSVRLYSDRALAVFPGSVDIMIDKGYAQSRGKDPRGAAATFRNAYRKAGNDSIRSVVAGILGDTYHETGSNRRAYRHYERALRLYPDNAGVLNNYAYYLSEENRNLEKALDLSVRSNELVSNNSTFLDTHGWILYKLGRYREAKNVMHQAVSFDMTNSAVLLFHYAEILYALGDNFMAEVYWKRALERGYDSETITRRLETVKNR